MKKTSDSVLYQIHLLLAHLVISAPRVLWRELLLRRII